VQIPQQSDAQVDFYLTDYVANSLLYHAHRKKSLDILVNDKNATLKQHLQTNCPKNAPNPCLGNIYYFVMLMNTMTNVSFFHYISGNQFSEINKKFTTQSAQFVVTNQNAPFVIFTPNGNNFTSNQTIDFVAKNKTAKDEKFLSISSTIQAILNFNVGQNGTLNVNLNQLNLTNATIVSTTLSGDKNAMIKNATDFYQNFFVQKILVPRLAQGFILVDNGNQVLLPLSVQPKITFGQRVAVLSGPMNIDQSKLQKLAEKALQNVQGSI